MAHAGGDLARLGVLDQVPHRSGIDGRDDPLPIVVSRENDNGVPLVVGQQLSGHLDSV